MPKDDKPEDVDLITPEPGLQVDPSPVVVPDKFVIRKTFVRGGVVVLVVYIPEIDDVMTINFGSAQFDRMGEEEIDYTIEKMVTRRLKQIPVTNVKAKVERIKKLREDKITK